MNTKSGQKRTRGRKRGPKGGGTIIARGGRYVMRWREGGKVKQEATPFLVGAKGAKEAARELLAERTQVFRLKARRDQIAVLLAEREEIDAKLRKLEAVAAEKPREASGLKLGGLVEAWKASPWRRDTKPAMTAEYARQLAAFVAWAGEGVAFADVGEKIAQEYAAELSTRSGNTYNKHINTLSAAWKAVGRTEGVKANPWADLPRKRLETHSRRALTQKEVDAILGKAEGELKALVLIGLRTGLRLGDAATLKWGAWRKDGAIEVTTAKTGAEVCLPGARLLAEVRAALGVAKGAAVDPTGEVTPELARVYKCKTTRSEVSKKVMALFERAGIETREKRKGWAIARATASFHSLRHTFVTRAIEAGVPAAIVRALVGHTRETMTEHYTHIGGAAMLEAFTKAGV